MKVEIRMFSKTSPSKSKAEPKPHSSVNREVERRL